MRNEISKTELFRGLSDDHLDHLVKLCESIECPANTELIKESEVGDSMYLILDGRVDVHVSIPGSSHSEVLATLKENEVVGELTLLGKERRSAQVIARDNLRALRWTKSDLLDLFDREEKLGYQVLTNLASLLADRLIATNLVLRNVLTEPRNVFI